MADRITDSTIVPDYVDGQLLEHTDVNKIISVFKTGINANNTEIQNIKSGTQVVGNASSLNGLGAATTTSGTLSDDDTKLPSEKMVKTYVDAKVLEATPKKGVDYFTDTDILDVKNSIKASIIDDVDSDIDEKLEQAEEDIQSYTTGKKNELDASLDEHANNIKTALTAQKTDSLDAIVDAETTAKSDIESTKSGVISDFNAVVTSKTNSFNTNVETKTTTYNDNASSKLDTYNSNAERLTTAYEEIAAMYRNDLISDAKTKINEYDTNASSKLEAYNTNDTTKTNEYNTNASSKVEAYNTNATEKTNTFNSNYEEKVEAFNNNASAKQQEFDDNASSYEARIETNESNIEKNKEKIQDNKDSIDNLQGEVLGTGEETGASIHIEDSANAEIKDITVDGVAKQDGEPTPESPQEISVIEDNFNVEFCGKNLVSEDKIVSSSDKSLYHDALYIDYDFKPNTTYTIGINTISGNEYYFNEIMTNIWHSFNGGYETFTFTTLSDISEAKQSNGYVILKNNKDNTNDNTFTNIILVEGTESNLTYEPYNATSISVDLQGNTMAKINDTYKDYLYIDYDEDGEAHLFLKKMVYLNNSYNGENYEYYIGTKARKDGTFESGTLTTGDKVYYSGEATDIDLGIIELPSTIDSITNVFTDCALQPNIDLTYYRNFVSTIRNLQVNNKALLTELQDCVKFDDYATESKGGVVKASSGFNVSTDGSVSCGVKTNDEYMDSSNDLFISKGTLENVLTERIGTIETSLTSLNDGDGVE